MYAYEAAKHRLAKQGGEAFAINIFTNGIGHPVYSRMVEDILQSSDLCLLSHTSKLAALTSHPTCYHQQEQPYHSPSSSLSSFSSSQPSSPSSQQPPLNPSTRPTLTHPYCHLDKSPNPLLLSPGLSQDQGPTPPLPPSVARKSSSKPSSANCSTMSKEANPRSLTSQSASPKTCIILLAQKRRSRNEKRRMRETICDRIAQGSGVFRRERGFRAVESGVCTWRGGSLRRSGLLVVQPGSSRIFRGGVVRKRLGEGRRMGFGVR